MVKTKVKSHPSIMPTLSYSNSNLMSHSLSHLLSHFLYDILRNFCLIIITYKVTVDK